jgi:hypothetical protein
MIDTQTARDVAGQVQEVYLAIDAEFGTMSGTG